VHAAEDVSVLEIILGVMKMMPGLRTLMPGLTKIMPGITKFFPRIAEVLGSVVTTLAAITAATIVLAVVIVIEQTTHFLSDESSDGTSENTSDDTSDFSKHSEFSIVARDARACSMPTPGCLPTGPLRQKQIRPSVTCRTFFLCVSTLPQARLSARTPRP